MTPCAASLPTESAESAVHPYEHFIPAALAHRMGIAEVSSIRVLSSKFDSPVEKTRWTRFTAVVLLAGRRVAWVMGGYLAKLADSEPRLVVEAIRNPTAF